MSGFEYALYGSRAFISNCQVWRQRKIKQRSQNAGFQFSSYAAATASPLKLFITRAHLYNYIYIYISTHNRSQP